jgi:hypothetical protein
MKVISGEKDQSRIPSIGNEQLVFLGSEGDGMGGLESAYALKVGTRLQVEHLDGVVYLGRNEEMIPLEINREVIKVPGNFWKVDGAQKCDGRLRSSSLCTSRNAHEEDDCENKADALLEEMR